MSATWTKVRQDLSRKKTRTLLVVLSIAVGVLGVSTVLGVGDRLAARLQDNYLEANPADLVVLTGPAAPELVGELAQLPNVTAAEGALVFNTRWQWDGQWQPLVIEASPNLDGRQIDQVDLTEGNLPAGGELLVERTAQDIVPAALDQSVVVQGPQGEETLAISGFGRSATHPPASFSKVSVAFVSLAEAERLLGQAKLNVVRLKLADLAQAEVTADQVRDRLAAESIPVLSLTTRDPNDFPGRDGVQSILLLMSLLGALALVLSGFLVINTIATILAAEIPQIGTMKAIGATRWAVMRVYLALVEGYGLVGSILGVALGVVATNLLAGYIAGLTNVDAPGWTISPAAVVAGLVIGLVTPLLAAWWPVWRGTRITVREAISNYGLSRPAGPLQRFLAHWRGLPFTVALSFRSLFRSQGRTALTLLTLAAAGVAFVAVQATSASLNHSLDILTDTYNADVLVELDRPVATADLRGLLTDSAAVVETWLDAPAEVAEKAVTLNGVPVETTLYKKNLADGRWFQPGETGVIILQEKFARDQQLGVGDRVTAQVGQETLTWEVVGIVRDYNESGLAPLAPYEQLAATLGWTGLADALLIQADQRDAANVNALAAGLADTLPRLGVQGTVSTMDDLREQAQAGFRVIVLFLAGMAALVTIVGALGLVGTLAINVTERQREIGVMRSLGAASSTIVQIFWLEGLCLGLLSWGLAAVVGYPLARLFTQLLSEVLIPLEFYLPPATLLTLGLGLLVVASLASVGPAVAASRARVNDIVRYG
ncbi:MAG: FtsX-like permease family protein [Chloroflexota bacterium]